MQLKNALSTTFGLLMLSAAVIATAADMPLIKPLRVHGRKRQQQYTDVHHTLRCAADHRPDRQDRYQPGIESHCRFDQVRQLHWLGSHPPGQRFVESAGGYCI